MLRWPKRSCLRGECLCDLAADGEFPDDVVQATGGLTYAQLESDDPARQTALTASFLRASLYTSVVAFGIALMAGGIGLALVLIGAALLFINRPATFEVTLDSEGG